MGKYSPLFAMIALCGSPAYATTGDDQTSGLWRCEQSLDAQWGDRSSRFLAAGTAYELELEMFARNGRRLAAVPGRLRRATLEVDDGVVFTIGIWPRLWAAIDRPSWEAHSSDRVTLICAEALRARAGYVDVNVKRPGATEPIFYIRWTSSEMPSGYRSWKRTESGESPVD